jgi:hypothetical protein
MIHGMWRLFSPDSDFEQRLRQYLLTHDNVYKNEAYNPAFKNDAKGDQVVYKALYVPKNKLRGASMTDFWQPDVRWAAYRPRLGGDNDPARLSGRFWYLLDTFATEQEAIEALRNYHLARGVQMADVGDRQYFNPLDLKNVTNPSKIGYVITVASDDEPMPFPMTERRADD